MKKAASIFLRAEIEPRDLQLLIHWMENPSITQYLNEEPNLVPALRQLRETVPAPLLTFRFHQRGRFFLVCRESGESIGFVKLRELPQRGVYEIVYVIGEESLWGHGYGESAIRKALSKVFWEWRGERVIARIYPANLRSIRSVLSCGFRQDGAGEHLHRYSITAGDCLRRP